MPKVNATRERYIEALLRNHLTVNNDLIGMGFEADTQENDSSVHIVSDLRKKIWLKVIDEQPKKPQKILLQTPCQSV